MSLAFCNPINLTGCAVAETVSLLVGVAIPIPTLPPLNIKLSALVDELKLNVYDDKLTVLSLVIISFELYIVDAVVLKPVILVIEPLPDNIKVPLEKEPPVTALIVVFVTLPPFEVTLNTFSDNVAAVTAVDIKPVILVFNVPVPANVIVPLEYEPPVTALIVVVVEVPPFFVTDITLSDNVDAVTKSVPKDIVPKEPVPVNVTVPVEGAYVPPVVAFIVVVVVLPPFDVTLNTFADNVVAVT